METGIISKEGWDKVSEMIARNEKALEKLYGSPQMCAFRFRESLLTSLIKNKIKE